MRRLAIAAAILLVLVLSACGGSSNSVGTSSLSTSAPASGSTTSSTSTTAAASTTTVTTTVAGPPLCVAADLRLSFLGQQGATGHGLLGFSLRNGATHSCHTFGYPGVLFLDKAGGPLPTQSMRTTRDFFGTAPEVSLLLAPGQTASFRIGVTHGADGAACSTAYGLQVTPPDDTAMLRIHIPGGTYECRTATLSPLRPGSSAYS